MAHCNTCRRAYSASAAFGGASAEEGCEEGGPSGGEKRTAGCGNARRGRGRRVCTPATAPLRLVGVGSAIVLLSARRTAPTAESRAAAARGPNGASGANDANGAGGADHRARLVVLELRIFAMPARAAFRRVVAVERRSATPRRPRRGSTRARARLRGEGRPGGAHGGRGGRGGVGEDTGAAAGEKRGGEGGGLVASGGRCRLDELAAGGSGRRASLSAHR